MLLLLLLMLLLLLLCHLDALRLRWLGGQCNDRPAVPVTEVKFLARELASSEELCDVGAG